MKSGQKIRYIFSELIKSTEGMKSIYIYIYIYIYMFLLAAAMVNLFSG
jgi:hypothetical protein